MLITVIDVFDLARTSAGWPERLEMSRDKDIKTLKTDMTLNIFKNCRNKKKEFIYFPDVHFYYQYINNYYESAVLYSAFFAHYILHVFKFFFNSIVDVNNDDEIN